MALADRLRCFVGDDPADDAYAAAAPVCGESADRMAEVMTKRSKQPQANAAHFNCKGACAPVAALYRGNTRVAILSAVTGSWAAGRLLVSHASTCMLGNVLVNAQTTAQTTAQTFMTVHERWRFAWVEGSSRSSR